MAPKTEKKQKKQKKPATGYALFVQQNYDKKKSFADNSKALSAAWKKMDEPEKAVFKKKKK